MKWLSDEPPDVTDPNEPALPTDDQAELTGGYNHGTEDYPGF